MFMKYFKLILLLVMIVTSTSNIYAKDIEYTNTNNGIIQIGSKPKATLFNGGGFMRPNGNSHDLEYNLELYSEGNTKHYAIRFTLNTLIYKLKYAYDFPCESKILLKLKDDSIIELTSIYRTSLKDYITQFNPKMQFTVFCRAQFPITEEQLKRCFKGIKKIRVEVLTLDEETNLIAKEHVDKDFKKDKIGKELEKWYDEINKELEAILAKIQSNKNTNINDNF